MKLLLISLLFLSCNKQSDTCWKCTATDGQVKKGCGEYPTFTDNNGNDLSFQCTRR